ncbi:hypothetical protein PVK06_020455 [Gossypium arboreum]|uniref:Uncharacterized protein n=1 Tax=Gossypium arboreum TaxID=29729 RepID=A0ABR0PMQ8_GOSAR|nr:hypothetical protein PVK06_020455 [Gossypium arboreum]
MEKGGSSREVGIEAPKFKRRKVSAVRDFPPGCGRGTTSDFELRRQIATDQSSQGKYRLFFNGPYECDLGLKGYMNEIGPSGPYACCRWVRNYERRKYMRIAWLLDNRRSTDGY